MCALHVTVEKIIGQGASRESDSLKSLLSLTGSGDLFALKNRMSNSRFSHEFENAKRSLGLEKIHLNDMEPEDVRALASAFMEELGKSVFSPVINAKTM